MIGLALTSVRHRVAAVLATFIAVLVGAGLFIACGGIFETAIRLDAPPQRLAAAPLVVAGPGDYQFADGSGSTSLPERSTLDPTVASRIAATPDVGRVVPDASFPAVVLAGGVPLSRTSQTPSGHAWASAVLTPYTLSGRAPRTADEVVLDVATANAAGARVGTRLRIAVDGTPATYVVTGLATPSRTVDGPAVFFADARGHAPQAIGVYPSAGTSSSELAGTLRRALPSGVTIRSGAARGDAEFTGVSGSRLPLIILSAVFGGLVIVVMGIVVAATASLSIRRRHRELALLRATGATPFQTRRLVRMEALVVALLGAAAGAALGMVAGHTLFDQLRTHHVLPSALTFHQGPLPYAAGILVAVAAVWVATTLASRPAERVSAIEALREATIPVVALHPLRRVLAGLLAVGTLVLGVATMFMSPTNASALGGPAVLTGAIALALVAPMAVQRMAERCARVASPRRGAASRLAAVNLRARAVQYGAVLTPITIATAIALGNIYSQTTQDDAARSAYLGELRADVVVTSQIGGFSSATIDRIARMGAVAGASELVTSQGWLEHPFDAAHTSDPLRLLGISPASGRPIYTGHVHDGTLARLQPGTVALPTGLAHDLHIRLGDHVTVGLGDGARVDAVVVATVDQPAGYEQLLLPAQVLAAHTSGQLPTDLLLRTSDRTAVTKAVTQLPGVQVGGPELLRRQFDAGLGIQAWINYLIAALALAYAALATINTLAVSILDRRREFGLQRLTGATRREVTRMIYREVCLIGALGYVAGAVIATFTVWPITIASGQLLPSGPLWVFGASIGTIVLLLAPITGICARIAMRQPAALAAAGSDN